MTDRDAMERALEALKKCRYRSLADEIVDPAITALRERLAQPEQEPVLETVYETIIQWDEGGGKRSRRELARRIVALYNATQPERHELQAKGEHPAPCARYCEATAFQIVIRNLKAQLAQPEQEPVAWLDGPHLVVRLDMRDRLAYKGPWVDLGRAIPDKWIPFLFTAPPQRKPLGREKEIALREGYCADAESSYFGARADCIDTPQNRQLFGAGFERGWQAAHGIKENT